MKRVNKQRRKSITKHLALAKSLLRNQTNDDEHPSELPSRDSLISKYEDQALAKHGVPVRSVAVRKADRELRATKKKELNDAS